MQAEVPTSAALLARARSCREAADRAEADLLATTVAWAARHPEPAEPLVTDPFGQEDTVLSGPSRGQDQPWEVAGPGAPTVSELALVEYAAVLGMTTDAGRRYLGDALELAHRLPRVCARVLDGLLPVWRARRVAQATRDLSPAAAADVDARVAPVAHAVGHVTLSRLVEEARARVDPEEAELAALEAAEVRHATLHRLAPGHELAGLADFTATLDLPDALDLDAVVSDLAAELARHGATDSLDVRRARALGLLARGHRPAPRRADRHEVPEVGRVMAPEMAPPPAGRAVTLYVHIAAEALYSPGSSAGGIDLARLEQTRGPVHAETMARWLGRPGTHITLKPVIDTREHLAVDAYEVPDRIAEHVRLTRHTCAFPWCTRPARGADLDHITAYAPPGESGPPGQTATHNLAPLCRRHHRAKTHHAPTDDPHGARWRYHRDPDRPGAYLWTSPHGYRFRVHPHGTSPLTPAVSEPALVG